MTFKKQTQVETKDLYQQITDQIIEALKNWLRLGVERSNKTDQTVSVANSSINSTTKKAGIRFLATLRSLCEYRPFLDLLAAYLDEQYRQKEAKKRSKDLIVYLRKTSLLLRSPSVRMVS